MYPGAAGRFDLYDDQGRGFGYAHGRYTLTAISHVERGGLSRVTIGPAHGRFPGALKQRSWQVRLLGMPPTAVVRIDGRRQQRRWRYDAAAHTLTVSTGPLASDRTVTITAR